MRPQRGRVLAVLGITLVVVALLAVGRGAVTMSPGTVLAALFGEASPRETAILWTVRLPRIALAILVGAALAGSGALLQGVARNPLADPAVLGISGGAALGAVTCLVAGASHPYVLPIAAFGGALAVTFAALRLARVDGRISAATLVLGGVGLAALASAGFGIALYLADDVALRSITFWSLGSLGAASWTLVGAIAIPIGIALACMPRLARDLDRLALGELAARHVGVEVERTIRRAAILAALAVGAAVATSGVIGFVGLVVPYLVRGVVGPGHRTLLPAAMLGGAILVVLADLVARTLVAPTELPIGVVTALVGAPVLLALVRRGRATEVLA